jgi:aminobenzoyl-glutamate utilization protein B
MALRLKKTSRKSIYGKSRFIDLDVCLDWHPDYENKANKKYSRLYDYFQRKSAAASLERSEHRCRLFTTGINFMREHVKPSVRMHYVYKMEAKFLM